jgi:N-acetylglutamate synthase-like GNAT family acetyltransferase
MQVDVRAARQQDRTAIIGLVRQARLNPAGLDWPRFMVADDGGRIVGVAQVRRHADGALELASLAVVPAARGHGIATALITSLLRDETAEVYTLIDRPYAGHFGRWRFREIDPAALPRSVARVHRVGRIVTALASVLARRRIRIVPLRRPAAG